MARVLSGRRAFSLAEALLAIALCAVVVMSVIALAITASRANRQSAEEAQATALASDMLQQFLYDLPPVSHTWWRGSSVSASAYQQDTSSLGSREFRRLLYVSDLPWTATAGIKRAEVVVTWNGGRQKVSVARLLYAHD